MDDVKSHYLLLCLNENTTETFSSHAQMHRNKKLVRLAHHELLNY